MDYKDISVDQYLNIRATIKEHEGSELDLHVKLISLIFGMSEDEVLDLPLPKFEELNKELSFLYKQPKITGKIPSKIVLNGRKYTVVKDAKKLTASQYIDYNSYCDLPDPDTHIAQVLSVFLIPEGEKYGSYEIEPVIDEISNYLSAQLAFDVCFFFQKKSLRSIKNMLIYFGVMTRMMKRKVRKHPKLKEQMEELQKKLTTMVILLQRSEDEYTS